MGNVHWISSDENEAVLISAQSEPPDYETMRDYVGGYIEIVTVLFNDQPAQMIVNEEGVLQGLPENKRATEIYWAAAKKRGYDLSKEEDRDRLKEESRKQWMELGAEVVDMDPRGTAAAPVIQGNAIVLEGLVLE